MIILKVSYKDKIKDLRNDAQETQAAIKIKDKLTELKSKNNAISSYRWIWELIQNAKDCPNSLGKIDIEIIYNKSEHIVEFKHNGQLFTTKNIVYLVEQVSTKERTGETKNTGKFGTGFLTTNLLSPNVNVSGYLHDKEDDSDIASFTVEIDRSGEDIEEIKSSIKKSCDQLEKYTTSINYEISENQMNTIFKYSLDENGIIVAENGLKNFLITAPYVFAFVPELNMITINNNGEISKYTRTREMVTRISNAFVTRIVRNNSNEPINIFTIENDGIMLAVEIKQFNQKNHIVPFDNDLPKIFCDFPLLGTHDFSFPVVINSRDFNPNEPRNGIYLVGNISKQNKELLIKACNLYVSMINYFIANDYKDIYNVVCLLPIVNKEWLDVEWYDEAIIPLLKENISKLFLFKMCDGSTKNLEPDEWGDGIFLSSDEDKEIREKVWQLSSKLFPDRHICYSDIDNWYNSLWKECRNYGIIDLINNVEIIGNLNELSKSVSDPIVWLRNLYFLIHNKFQNDFNVFNQGNKIYPNQHGVFCSINELKSDEGIEELYKQAANIINIDLKSELLDCRFSGFEITNMSFNDAVNRMIYHSQENYIDPSDFYKSIIGMCGQKNDKQTYFVSIYNLLYKEYPINFVKVNNHSNRLLNIALDYWCDKICGEIDTYNNLSDIKSSYGFNSIDNVESLLSQLIRYLLLYNKTELLEKYAIIPNQKGELRKKSYLYREYDNIPEFLKIACCVAGVDFKEELVSLKVDISEIIFRKRGYKEFSDVITNYVRNNKNRISGSEIEKQAFNETYLWLRSNKENPEINRFFSELMEHLYWFYNDEEISKSITKATEFDALLNRFGISSASELEMILSSKTVQAVSTTITEELLCQYGIDDEENLKLLIEGRILDDNFIHDSESDMKKFQYVQQILKRSHDKIQEYLKSLPEYNLEDSVDVHKTIFTARKDGKEIYIIARPSDYDEVILYYGAEIDTLDYTQDFELWVENGKSQPEKLTFGKILRLTGVNRIPLRRIRNND